MSRIAKTAFSKLSKEESFFDVFSDTEQCARVRGAFVERGWSEEDANKIEFVGGTVKADPSRPRPTFRSVWRNENGDLLIAQHDGPRFEGSESKVKLYVLLPKDQSLPAEILAGVREETIVKNASASGVRTLAKRREHWERTATALGQPYLVLQHKERAAEDAEKRESLARQTVLSRFVGIPGENSTLVDERTEKHVVALSSKEKSEVLNDLVAQLLTLRDAGLRHEDMDAWNICFESNARGARLILIDLGSVFPLPVPPKSSSLFAVSDPLQRLLFKLFALGDAQIIDVWRLSIGALINELPLKTTLISQWLGIESPAHLPVVDASVINSAFFIHEIARQARHFYLDTGIDVSQLTELCKAAVQNIYANPTLLPAEREQIIGDLRNALVALKNRESVDYVALSKKIHSVVTHSVAEKTVQSWITKGTAHAVSHQNVTDNPSTVAHATGTKPETTFKH